MQAGWGLTLAEKQWLQAALNLMGLASVLGGGVGIVAADGEEMLAVVVDVVDEEEAVITSGAAPTIICPDV